MKADLHLHSCFSPDSIASPRALCRAACKKGLGAIALTDHDTVDGWDALRCEAEKAGLLFVPGEERKVFDGGRLIGELLCLFLTRPIKRQDLAGIVEEVIDQDGLVALAHPFDRRRPAVGFHLNSTNPGPVAVEVRNGRTWRPSAGRMAAEYADLYSLPVLAGSDAHTPFEVGSVYIEADFSTVSELKRAIRQGRVRVAGGPSSPLFSLYSGLRKLGPIPGLIR